LRHDGSINRRQALAVLGLGAAGAILAETGPKFPKHAIVRTLLADLPPSALANGATLFHEHLSIDLPPVNPGRGTPAPAATSDVDLMLREVATAGSEGVTCIVDGGHPDMGRNLDNLKRIALGTKVHIVASAGYYMQRTYPADIATKSEDQIADGLAAEATRDGLGAFGEIGQSANGAALTPDEHKVFRAVGKAHLRTNLPIFTHNAYGTGPNVPREAGLRQLDVFESVGVNPQRVAIGHTCCLDDPKAEIIREIAKRGAFVGFDRVTGGFVPDDKKVIMVLAFLEAGYADHLLLCSDFTGRRTAARPGYGNTLTVFIPKLRAAGIKEETLHAITVDNPRRFLACMPKKARPRATQSARS
jgi:predicted metal-dependent phosphotriesterase family hydrolase